jgi:hypothetical protein
MKSGWMLGAKAGHIMVNPLGGRDGLVMETRCLKRV